MSIIPLVDPVSSPPKVRPSDHAPAVHVPILGSAQDPELHGPILGSVDLNIRHNKMWKITYSTSKDLDRGRIKAYDGSLELAQKEDFLILRNAKGFRIGCRDLHRRDSLSLGAKLTFPWHVVRIGDQIQSADVARCMEQVKDPPQLDVSGLSAASLNDDHIESASQTSNAKDIAIITTSVAGEVSDSKRSNSVAPIDRDASSVYDSLALGLNFQKGLSFARFIRNKYALEVHSSDDSDHFTMVVSFGRANFRLTEDLVSLALEAAIGGYCRSLKVSYIKERVFSFVVSSKRVGFHILDLRSFSCPQFKCFFHPWGLGGPNWKREFVTWQKECNEEWTLVSPSKRRVQLGLLAMKTTPLKSAMKSANGAKRKL
jgi:hypothetical protein